eukprot:5471069-Prymnesium_polylepis.1
MKGRSHDPHRCVLGSSHKLLLPPRCAGVDHKPSATAAPPCAHLAESKLQSSRSHAAGGAERNWSTH